MHSIHSAGMLFSRIFLLSIGCIGSWSHNMHDEQWWQRSSSVREWQAIINVLYLISYNETQYLTAHSANMTIDITKCPPVLHALWTTCYANAPQTWLIFMLMVDTLKPCLWLGTGTKHHQTGKEEEVGDIKDSIIKKQQVMEHSLEHQKRRKEKNHRWIYILGQAGWHTWYNLKVGGEWYWNNSTYSMYCCTWPLIYGLVQSLIPIFETNVQWPVSSQCLTKRETVL